MNSFVSEDQFNPLPDPIGELLAEIAFSAQLPPSLYKLASSRANSVCTHLDGTDAFADQIEHFYPQGSMAIDATISTRGTDAEYDIDIVAQLGGRFRGMSPCKILDELFEALDGYRGMEVKRQTRCVTIYYSDGMHLDITPALREYGTADRQSLIAHAKGPFDRDDDEFIAMNAYGFADWYIERTPIERRVVKAASRFFSDAGLQVRADADIDEVPDQTPFTVKNTATLALQLVKRYRNIVYESEKGRIPPSVMLSCFAGHAAQANMTLSDMLIRQCDFIAREMRAASVRWEKVEVRNPRHYDDLFTDRWPRDIIQQDTFARKLEDLAEGLRVAKSGRMPAWKINDWLRDMFGSHVVTKAADAIAKRATAIQEGRHRYRPDGRIVLPASAGLASPAIARGEIPSPKHTFFGGKLP
ncbi:nucleotidyltransferase domain-containing protein [Pelagibacterium sediminicola]|uniref:nucleotidyltransferase domain-containing protein n=1 Tax=Pelagibacterium sediminicola TaxID=2248761 RepID=UPI000E313D95|nr:nucleotidyltransferase [Pelagibacterium sediminicola]